MRCWMRWSAVSDRSMPNMVGIFWALWFGTSRAAVVAGLLAIIPEQGHAATASGPVIDYNGVSGKLISVYQKSGVGAAAEMYTVPTGKRLLLTQACINNTAAITPEDEVTLSASGLGVLMFRSSTNLMVNGAPCELYSPAMVIPAEAEIRCNDFNDGVSTGYCKITGVLVN